MNSPRAEPLPALPPSSGANPATSKQRLTQRAKVGAYVLLRRIQFIVAATLRHTPVVNRWLGLPSFRIRSLRHWTEVQRRDLHWLKRGKAAVYIPILPPTTSVRSPVTGCGPSDAFDRERFHAHGESFVVRIPNARIVGPGGGVITPDGGLVEEVDWGDWHIDKDRAVMSWMLSRGDRLAGNYASIAGISAGGGYSHWLLDSLPRLWLLETLGLGDLPILLGAALQPYHEDSLSAIGWDPKQTVMIGSSTVAVDVLYLPSFVGAPGNPHPGACAWLRERIMSESLSRGSRRLYVTRRVAGKRSVMNEKDLLPILEDRGFEVIESERLSFRAQVELFREAEAVVGAHGAGLTNILFAPPGCKVVELFEPAYVNVCYYALASTLGQQYSYIIGQPAGKAGAHHRISGHDDLVISPDQFAKTLDIALSS